MEAKVNNQKLSPKSPKFIKPMEVFMMRKKKRLDNNSPSRLKQFSPLKCINIISPVKSNAKSPLKRKTPPKRVDSKENGQRGKMTKIKSPRKGRPKRQLTFCERLVPVITIDEDANLDAPPLKTMRTSEASSIECPRLNKLPVDWSLKTKICFISKKQFPFKGSFKASEESQGTTAFVRCLYSPNKSSQKQENFNQSSTHTLSMYSDSNQMLDTSLAARLRQHCFVWMYPNFPWLPLFPRNNNLKVQTKSFVQEDSVMKTLYDDWSNSLRSLYYSTKVRQNAYFYVCGHSFTILFRAAGVGGIDEMNVLVYPTTSGFRKQLTEDEIKFTMPLAGDVPATQTDESSVIQNNDIADDEDSNIFLESLGLSQQDFPSLKQKIKTNYDSKQTSLIAMRGPDAVLFVTFLTTNSQYVIAKTGPLAGIPPTLLSPVAFHGASLLPLKLKEKEIVHRNEKIYSLEISGPILPNTVNGLCEFMRETQDGNFNASLSTHESTIPFATVNGSITGCHDNTLSLFATENLKDSGFGNTEFLRDICVQSQLSEKAISNVVLNENSYSLK